MMEQLDPRIVRVGIEVDGQLRFYEGLAVSATGTKYASPSQDECDLTITNLRKDVRESILTAVSPFNPQRRPIKMVLEAGRKSYGLSRIYTGDIVTATISQPPDITLKLQGLVGDQAKGNIVSRSGSPSGRLSLLAKGVADDLGLSLDFQAKDKNISNYSYTGAALKQVNRLEDTGGVNAYIDNGVLIVKDYNVPLNGRLRKLDLETGMIGIPEVTEQGLKVTMLLDNQTTCGGALEVTSKLYPAVNGTYVIYRLGFNIASRDTPFYWIAEAKRLNR